MPNVPISVTVTVKVRISTTHEFCLRVINVIETTSSNDIIKLPVNTTTR